MNIFPLGTKIHEKYDLKGRQPKRDETAERRMKEGELTKDNELARHFYIVDQEVASNYMEQLEKDVALLKECGMLDYSLLIGK
jgi:hypothetical protein